MKKTLLAGIAALSVLSASAAQADALPSKFLGKWCADLGGDAQPTPPGSEWTNTFLSLSDLEDCDKHSVIEVKQNEWTGWESGCRFTEVKTRFDPTIPANTKEMGVWVAHIKANCIEESCKWHSSFVLYHSMGALFMRGRNGKEECG
jgi:hypothetical protein